jgi:Holliday junction resolvasome RuvABC endonuclease subunit
MKLAQGSLIGVDLGTKTGIATVTFNVKPQRLKLQLLELDKEAKLREIKKRDGKDALRSNDPRVLALWLHLQDLAEHLPEPVWVAFEDVLFTTSRAQAQLWGSYRGALWTLPVHPSRYFSVPTSTLKKFAGAGGASKDKMQALLKRKLGMTDPREYDDNIVDAAWVLIWAAKTKFGVDIERTV